MGFFSRKDRALKKLRDVAEIERLPPFPGSVAKILDRLRDPDAAMAEIAEAVSWDPGLTVRLLKTVNAAAFGLRRQVDNVQHAVSFLGRSNLESLVLGLVIEDILPHEPAPGFDSRRYWRTAAKRAALARNLAEKVDPATQAEAFTVGLLQDMAVPVLAQARPAEYGPVLEEWHASRDAHLEELESSALGWDHAEVGGAIGDAWELPEGLVEGIRSHHPGEGGGGPAATRLVSLMRETQEEAGCEALIEEARSSYGLDPDWTAGAIARSEEQAWELARLMR